MNPSPPKPEVPPQHHDPYVIPFLVAIVILFVASLATAALVTIKAPEHASSLNAWLLTFIGVPLIGMVGYVVNEVKSARDEVKSARTEVTLVREEVNGRITELLRRLDEDKADQRTIGHSEGKDEERGEERGRVRDAQQMLRHEIQRRSGDDIPTVSVPAVTPAPSRAIAPATPPVPAGASPSPATPADAGVISAAKVVADLTVETVAATKAYDEAMQQSPPPSGM